MVSRLEMNAKLAQKDEKIAHLEWELEKIKKSSATMRQAEKELREELERTVSAQKLMLQISRSGGAPSAFRLPFCEICGFEFDDFPGRIPRLLSNLFVLSPYLLSLISLRMRPLRLRAMRPETRQKRHHHLSIRQIHDPVLRKTV